MTFEQLFTCRDWKPIRSCPGRYVLNGVSDDLRPEDLASGIAVTHYKTSAARDMVFVAVLEHGGLISYGRDDGTFVHTLNTAEGFERKLRQLEIDLSSV